MPATGRGGFRRTAYVLGLTSFVGGIPTPLYAGYAERFHFSAGTLGVIFGSYTLGVFLTLFFLAPHARRFGRRTLLAVAMGLTMAACTSYVLATGVDGLILARVFSGLAVGATTSVATAAMSDLEPNHDDHHVARVAVGANFGGFAVGALLSGLLATYAPYPYALVYVVAIAGSATGLWALHSTRETVAPLLPGEHAPDQRIFVPKELRPSFWVATGAIIACYSIYGLFGALIPSFVHSSLSVGSPAVTGAVVGAMFGCAALTQLATAQIRDRRSLLLGIPWLIGSLAVLGLVLRVPSWGLLAVVVVVIGVGVGLTFMGSGTLIDRLTTPANRDPILAGFYIAAYLALSVPTIGVAEASDRIGLTTAGLLFVGVLMVLLAFLGVRTYRTPTPPGGGGRPRPVRPGSSGLPRRSIRQRSH
jgi:predicted MFS family arabinose efflux permease